jgi:hypothetical protein
MRENRIEEAVVEHAERKGWLVRKVVYAGRRGAPDRFFFKDGQMVLVEFKSRGRSPDAQQVREHERLRKAGFIVHVVDTIEAGIALLGE